MIENIQNTEHLMKILYLVMKEANVTEISVDKKELASTIFDKPFKKIVSYEDYVSDKIIYKIEELEGNNETRD